MFLGWRGILCLAGVHWLSGRCQGFSLLGFWKKKPQLILLDHGLYRELNFSTRINYVALWKAIKDNSVKLGAGEDLYVLFAGVLSMRPWQKVVDPSADHLVMEGNQDDRAELQMYAAQYFSQISELLRRLPRLQGSSLETYFIIGKVASEALADSKRITCEGSACGMPSFWLEMILVEVRFLCLKIAMHLLQLKKAIDSC